METATWITAISTLIMAIATIGMAIIAGMALNSWKQELRFNKMIELYNDLFLLFFKIESFLDNLSVTYSREGEQHCNEKIEFYSSEIALFKSKIKIQKIFAWGDAETLDNGTIRATYQYDTFIDKYLNNREFKQNLKSSIMKIRKICEEKQFNLYK